MRACPECDALHRPVPLYSGGIARCWRCSAVLYRRRRFGLDTTLALTMAAAVTFVVANTFPIVALELQGQHSTTSLWGAVETLWRQDVPLLALLVLMTTIVVPALNLGAVLWLLVPLVLRRSPLGGARILRALTAIRPWGMVEVFMLGVLVALVKLAHIASVEPGVGLWAFGALIGLFAAAAASFDDDLVWAYIDAARRGATA